MAERPPRRVVVTGAAGLIGQILWRGLGEPWDLVGIDRRPTEDPTILEGDITRTDELVQLCSGADAVVHLATAESRGHRWEDTAGPNLEGTRSVFEAAWLARVPRVVFASSNHVTGGYEKDSPYSEILAGEFGDAVPKGIPLISHLSPIRPDGFYGVGKAAGEALGRFYADTYGLEVVCVRIGTVRADDRPVRARHRATLLTHSDLTSLIDASLRAEGIPFTVVYGVSGNSRRIWDLERAHDVLGWAPRDNASEMLD